jgi:dTDP-4-dehydrorhamnose 3,5-epimerase
MKIEETYLKGCFLIKPMVHRDERGYFMESYNKSKLEKNLGTQLDFVQDNESRSSYGVIRGLHFQQGDHAQAKLVRVIEGAVLDVVLDLRANSATFGQVFSIELTAINKYQLLIPRGFAHGYSVLSENALFAYKCDNKYNKESESGIAYNDKDLKIDWKIEQDNQIISPKDLNLQSFETYKEKVGL